MTKQLITENIKLALQKDKHDELAMPYGVIGLKYKHKNVIDHAAHKNHLGVYSFSSDFVK